MTARQTCIVLAGGLGTRLRSAVGGLPKCLAPVGGRSFIDIQLESLRAAGIEDFVLSLGYEAQTVIAAVSSKSRVPTIRYVVEPALLGTGGAITFAMDTLALNEVLVANGDTMLEGDIGKMLAPLDCESGELLRLAVVTVEDRSRFGGVQFDDDRFVTGFLEKGQSGPGPINAGLYRLNRAALPASGCRAYSLEADVIPGLVARRAVIAARICGSFTDIGVPEDYFRFCEQHAR